MTSLFVQVLDECLRAVSGFKGTEDLIGDRLVETPFVSDFVRDKNISSAPSYIFESDGVSRNNLSGSTEWCEAIEKHIPLSVCHASGVVCFSLFLHFIYWFRLLSKKKRNSLTCKVIIVLSYDSYSWYFL